MSTYYDYKVTDEHGEVCSSDCNWNHGGDAMAAMLADCLNGRLPAVPEGEWMHDNYRYVPALKFLVMHRDRLEAIAVVDEYGDVHTPAKRELEPSRLDLIEERLTALERAQGGE